MDDPRHRLREVIGGWKLSPEDQAEIVEEFAQHLEAEYADLVPRIGPDAARARVAAQLETMVSTDIRVPRRHRSAVSFTPAGWLSSLRRDVVYGSRSLMRRPGLIAAAAGALAIGIGLTTLMASLIYGTLIRGLPYADADRIVVLGRIDPEYGSVALEARDYLALQQEQRTLQAVGAFRFERAVVGSNIGTARFDSYRITPPALDLPRVQPILGRTFRDSDAQPGNEAVVVISHALWRDGLGGDSSITDSLIRIDRQPHRIVGVMPEGFGYPDNAALWRVLAVDLHTEARGEMNVIGRLRDGVTHAQATSELQVIVRHARATAHHVDSTPQLKVQPFVRGMMPDRVYSLMYAMFAAVGLVFLVACANVANLLLDRAVNRAKEIGIRTALGASRAAVIRQFLVESLLLSLMAAAGGIAIAHGGLLGFNAALADQERPSWVTFSIEPPVLFFVAFAAIVAAMLCGLLPAALASRADIHSALKDQSLGSSSRRVQRVSRFVVTSQIALSGALLVGAALMTKSVLNLRTVEPGYRTRDVSSAHFTLDQGDRVQRRTFLDQLMQEARQLDGVTAVALTNGSIGTHWGGMPVFIDATTSNGTASPPVRTMAVTSEFFATFDIPVLRGRSFADDDRAPTSLVAIVNQRFVDERMGGGNPIGRRIRLGDATAPSRTIVGVIPNLYSSSSLLQPWPAQVLTPLPHDAPGGLALHVRVSSDTSAPAEPLRNLFKRLDPDLPVDGIGTVAQQIARNLWYVTVFGTMFVSFGIAALLLAGVGLYAVIAFAVTRREREMGIRMALGATAFDVIRVIGREGALQVGAGTTIGLVLGAGIAQLGRAALFEVAPHDFVMYVVVVAVLALTGVVACIVPAVRATRVDPAVTLRAD